MSAKHAHVCVFLTLLFCGFYGVESNGVSRYLNPRPSILNVRNIRNLYVIRGNEFDLTKLMSRHVGFQKAYLRFSHPYKDLQIHQPNLPYYISFISVCKSLTGKFMKFLW